MKINKLGVIIIMICFLGAKAFAIRYYVKSGGDNDANGTSWETAFATLTKASGDVINGDEVWVAGGTYVESQTITIPEGVSFFGGFAGTESDLSERSPVNPPSVIDGYYNHRCVNNFGMIEGFSITRGYVGEYQEAGGVLNYGEIRECRIYENSAHYGGGIYNLTLNYSKGIVTNCVVYNNLAGNRGGGIYNSRTVKNCIVYNNKSNYGAGGIYNSGKVMNCVVYENSANFGGGIYNYEHSTVVNCTIYRNQEDGISGEGVVVNCISWKNRMEDIHRCYKRYCCFGCSSEGEGNFSANPLFVNTAGDISTWDFHLQNGSPCIDAGTSKTVTGSDPYEDIEGNPRPGEDGKVCIGAYESPDEYLPGIPEPNKRLYVKPDGSDEENGSSWNTALKTIKKATSQSFRDDSIYDMWVAGGTFQEGESILIPETVSLYGGFCGRETYLYERSSSVPTVIDGNNEYRCVLNYGIIDGFYVTKGYYDYGGGIRNFGRVRNCIIYLNKADESGGGIYNSYGMVSNCTLYFNNSGESLGHSIYNFQGTIINCIAWGNSYSDIGNYEGTIRYCCYKHYNLVDGNISSDPFFVDTSGEPSLWDFNLRFDSPCIDAGDPDPVYNDACLPPGKGTERNDMGAFGGPHNCILGSPRSQTMMSLITRYGDSWGAANIGAPPLENPYRRAWLGFRFSPLEGWNVFKGDVDNMGLDDLIQITPYGDAWVSISYNSINDIPTRWGWLGFRYDEKDGYNGWIPLVGDANGDGFCDLIQVTEYGDAWIALSRGSQFEAPTRWGWLGYRFNRAVPGENGALPLSGDVNGDGLCDLIQLTEYTDVWVALSTGSQFETPTRWGWLGFKYRPFEIWHFLTYYGWYPLCGDVNGDGLDDLIQVTPTGDPWVSLSTGTMFESPNRWGWLNFYYDEEQGYYPLLGDVNADGKEDLIQITPEGEVWVAPSLGDSFDTPEYWGNPGFLFDRLNGYLPFFLEF